MPDRGPMRALILLLALLAAAPACRAHSGSDEHGGWLWDPWLTIPLMLCLTVYLIGLYRLRRHRRHRPNPRQYRTVAYVVGWLTLAGALVTPFHALAEELFSFHMVEHEIVMAVSAPLLVAARPYGVLLWALPKGIRFWLAHTIRAPVLYPVWCWLIRPFNASLIHGAAIWLWHIPAVFDATVTSLTIHRWQHLSFLVTALIFWYSLAPVRRSGEAVWYVFFTMLHTSLLGALMALSPRVLYTQQTAHAAEWGLTALQDQQLAGMLMWIPAGTVYAGAALWFAARWIRSAPHDVARSLNATRNELGRP